MKSKSLIEMSWAEKNMTLEQIKIAKTIQLPKAVYESIEVVKEKGFSIFLKGTPCPRCGGRVVNYVNNSYQWEQKHCLDCDLVHDYDQSSN